MKIQSFVGELKTEGTGSLVLDTDEKTFTIKVDDLQYEFTFVEGGEEPRAIHTVDGHSLRTQLFGFNERKGMVLHMRKTGINQGRTLSIALAVYAVGEEDDLSRVVHYNILSSAGASA